MAILRGHQQGGITAFGIRQLSHPPPLVNSASTIFRMASCAACIKGESTVFVTHSIRIRPRRQQRVDNRRMAILRGHQQGESIAFVIHRVRIRPRRPTMRSTLSAWPFCAASSRGKLAAFVIHRVRISPRRQQRADNRRLTILRGQQQGESTGFIGHCICRTRFQESYTTSRPAQNKQVPTA